MLACKSNGSIRMRFSNFSTGDMFAGRSISMYACVDGTQHMCELQSFEMFQVLTRH